MTLRIATVADIPAMHGIRRAVRENVLRSKTIQEKDYISEITTTGRGWVIEEAETIVAFAIANRITGNVWALFVDPRHEGKGHGQVLNACLLSWLFAQGVPRAWLTTDPDSRAHRFYLRAGWQLTRILPDGQAEFECLPNPAGSADTVGLSKA